MTALRTAALCSRSITDMRILAAVLLTVVLAGILCGAEEPENELGGSVFEMQMVYRYSEEFRKLTKGRPGWEHLATEEWPQHGTPEFYHTLVTDDRHRHASRNLLTTDVYSLSPSNATLFGAVLGAIHYAFIKLGTPAKLFLVGLDTGSDLLWVPCECEQCAPANWTNYGVAIEGLEFAIYSPSDSSTSNVVACNSDICTRTLEPSSCDVASPQACTYKVSYLSANTSSSGTIVQDVVYLNRESKTGPEFTTNIYFGCGKVQTGDFLTGGAPNGLFGLGPEAYSVPSTLVSSGVTQNVFSMCFGSQYDVGRLVFGKKPVASLQSTPLIATNPNVFYVIQLEGIVAGGKTLNQSGTVVFDTGTSLTYLPVSVVKAVGDAMASKTTLKTSSFAMSSVQLDYCWNATTNAEVESLLPLSFIFAGGGTWTIMNPFLGIADNGNLVLICLGLVSGETPIIGYNFMGHYEYFFDLGTSTFSWGPSDCSSSNTTNTIDVAPISAPSAPSQSPSTSSRPPTSLPGVQEPPPSSTGSDTSQAPSNGARLSKARTSSRQPTPFQVVYIALLTVFFHSLANLMC